MKKAYIAKLNMAQTCLAMIHAPEHDASQAVGSKCWKDAVHDAAALVEWILEESRTLERSKGVSSAGKIEARERLGDRAWAMAGSLHALAVTRHLPDLAAVTDFPRSRVTRGPSITILSRCATIHQLATEHLAMLADDNVTAADVVALGRCLEDFGRMHTHPREMRVAGRAASEKLDALFDELAGVFKHRLDRLVAKFAETAPDFHAAYQVSRKLVNLPTSNSRKPEALQTVTDLGCGEAQPQPRHPDPSWSEGQEPSSTPRTLEPVEIREGMSAPLFARCCGWSSTQPRSEPRTSVLECGSPLPLSMRVTSVDDDGFTHGWTRLNTGWPLGRVSGPFAPGPQLLTQTLRASDAETECSPVRPQH